MVEQDHKTGNWSIDSAGISAAEQLSCHLAQCPVGIVLWWALALWELFLSKCTFRNQWMLSSISSGSFYPVAFESVLVLPCSSQTWTWLWGCTCTGHRYECPKTYRSTALCIGFCALYPGLGRWIAFYSVPAFDRETFTSGGGSFLFAKGLVVRSACYDLIGASTFWDWKVQQCWGSFWHRRS